MQNEQARIWAARFNELFSGKEYTFVACYEYKAWEPEIATRTFDTATACEYDHKPGYGFVQWHDSYGVGSISIDDPSWDAIRADSDTRTIMVQGHAAKRYHWAFMLNDKTEATWRAMQAWATR